MTIKIWSNKVSKDEDFTEAKVRQPSLLKGINLTCGGSLSNIWPDIIIDITSDYLPADTFLSGPMLVVSESLAELILKNSMMNKVEFLPVDVRFKNQSQGSYGVLNVLISIDALNRKHSEFTVIDDLIDSIGKLSIDETKSGSEMIFQLDAIEWLLCVNIDLVSQIEQRGFTGVVFKTPTQWTPF
jgi:hypothetical protein